MYNNSITKLHYYKNTYINIAGSSSSQGSDSTSGSDSNSGGGMLQKYITLYRFFWIIVYVYCIIDGCSVIMQLSIVKVLLQKHHVLGDWVFFLFLTLKALSHPI